MILNLWYSPLSVHLRIQPALALTAISSPRSAPVITEAVAPSAQTITPRLTSAVACNRSAFSAQGGVENTAAFGQIVERRTQFLQVLAGEAARRSGMLL
jgi:hypothetical protein